jgi:hypothetical protein
MGNDAKISAAALVLFRPKDSSIHARLSTYVRRQCTFIIVDYLSMVKMAGQKGCLKSDDNIIAAGPSSPITPAGTRVTPFSAACLPANYKQAVLEQHPFFEDADIVEAYLGYGPSNTPNYRCWYRMMEADLSMVNR